MPDIGAYDFLSMALSLTDEKAYAAFVVLESGMRPRNKLAVAE